MRLLKRQRQLATLGRALILPRHRPTFGPRLNWTYSAFPIGLGLVILVTGIAFLSRIGLGRLPGDIMFQSTASGRLPSCDSSQRSLYGTSMPGAGAVHRIRS
jgi:Protein of unknown function (DUF2905)